MSRFTPERWALLSSHLDRALEMTADECNAWLDSLRVADGTLAAELQTLLEERSAIQEAAFLEGELPRPACVSQSGQTLGAYTLISPIGRGGAGSVWLAERSDGR